MINETYSSEFKTGVVATGYDPDTNVFCAEFDGPADMAGLTNYVDARYPVAVQIQTFIGGLFDTIYVKDGAGQWQARRLKQVAA
ncbi:hypothetical protein LP421_10570 [Rhizobium sp. RCAM05350]|nr:hypothetical protein LP421_10570 [Rhizobium sp. RCAM05350]